jgi:hypothetical protein
MDAPVGVGGRLALGGQGVHDHPDIRPGLPGYPPDETVVRTESARDADPGAPGGFVVPHRAHRSAPRQRGQRQGGKTFVAIGVSEGRAVKDFTIWRSVVPALIL